MHTHSLSLSLSPRCSLLALHDQVHTALFSTRAFAGRSAGGRYGDNVEEMDHSVGLVLRELQRLGVAEDTLVYFTSDNGPFGVHGDEAGGCGGLRGSKGQNWECGIRVPGIIRWPARIPANRTVSQAVSHMDLLPTLASLLRVQLPADLVIDGKDMGPLLFSHRHDEEEQQQVVERKTMGGKQAEVNECEKEKEKENANESVSENENENEQKNERTTENKTSASKDNEGGAPLHDVLYHYCGATVTAVRHGHFKMHLYTPVWDEGSDCCCPSKLLCECLGRHHDPPLLFDLRTDPGESSPLSYSLSCVADLADSTATSLAAEHRGGRERPGGADGEGGAVAVAPESAPTEEEVTHAYLHMWSSLQRHQRSMASSARPTQLISYPNPLLFPCCQQEGEHAEEAEEGVVGVRAGEMNALNHPHMGALVNARRRTHSSRGVWEAFRVLAGACECSEVEPAESVTGWMGHEMSE
jgi:Sulfatase/C-terminal region of aryl-sulfatase